MYIPVNFVNLKYSLLPKLRWRNEMYNYKMPILLYLNVKINNNNICHKCISCCTLQYHSFECEFTFFDKWPCKFCSGLCSFAVKSWDAVTSCKLSSFGCWIFLDSKFLYAFAMAALVRASATHATPASAGNRTAGLKRYFKALVLTVWSFITTKVHFFCDIK